MKCRIVASAAVIMVAAIGSAFAADLPVKVPAMVAPQPATWTGIYVGANLGGGIGTNSWTNYLSPDALCCAPAPLGSAGSGNTNGAVGGAQLGFNYQTGWVVWGVEGEFDWTGMKGHTELNSAFTSIDTAVKTNYISTVTGRIGGVFHDDVLIYLKGGAAFIQNSYNLAAGSFGLPLGNYSGMTDSRTGWTLGLGAEYRFDSRWSAKLEYDYIEFNTKTVNFPIGTAGCCGTPPFSIDVPLAVHEVKLGVNYKIW